MAEHEDPNRSAPVDYHFRLFVSGTTPRSLRAIAAIRDICEKIIPGRYCLDVIDVYDNPAAAQAEQVVAIPTLVMKLPLPRRLFVGDMSDTTRLLTALGAVVDSLEEDLP